MKTRSILKLAWRYLNHRRFAVSVSILAIAVSLLFVVVSGVVNFAVKKSAVESSIRYPLIVGPSGASGVQLILSAVFHIDKPSGTIPFEVYNELSADKRVIAAYPVAVADSYMNQRIIGVNQKFLDDLGAGVQSGLTDLSKPENAVFGHAAAQRCGVEIGDTFHGQHGMVGAEGAHEHAELTYRVVGILNPTNGPEDNAIYTSYESVWLIHSHAHHHHHGEPEHHKEEEHHHEAEGLAAHDNEHHNENQNHADDEHQKENSTGEVAEQHEEHNHKNDKYTLSDNKLTAVLVRTSNPAYTGMLEREYSLRSGTLAVDTGKSMRDFVGHLNKGEVFVELVSAAMLLIAFILILVTLLMSLNERRRDLALLRMLGVGRLTLSLTIMSEALFITFCGALGGLLAGHLLAFLASGAIRNFIGVEIEAFAVTNMEIVGLCTALAAGQILALLSMLAAYRMNPVEESARD